MAKKPSPITASRDKAEWRVEMGWFGIDGTFVGAKGCHAQFCIHWPVIDGQPDFSKQPKWEKI